MLRVRLSANLAPRPKLGVVSFGSRVGGGEAVLEIFDTLAQLGDVTLDFRGRLLPAGDVCKRFQGPSEAGPKLLPID